MSIGRNALYPCGSGERYKKCYFSQRPIYSAKHPETITGLFQAAMQYGKGPHEFPNSNN
jgi:hypothetical protein